MTERDERLFGAVVLVWIFGLTICAGVGFFTILSAIWEWVTWG